MNLTSLKMGKSVCNDACETRLYLITDDKSKSKFILELEANDELLAIKKYPNCISADLIKRCGYK